MYLIGLPGSGKSTIGKILAKHTQKSFIDSDAFLVRKTGVSIRTIFELEGELGFRKREGEVIQELVRFNNVVLATGGGSILDLQSRELLRTTGYIIYLQSTPAYLATRLSCDKTRPLLAENVLANLQQLYQERAAIYEALADIVYPVDMFTPNSERCSVQLAKLIQYKMQ